MIKKSLLLIPLLSLCSCFNNSVLYQNVSYGFNYENKEYNVVVQETSKTFIVKVENVYYIYNVGSYYTKDGKDILRNEFYTNPNRLYIYK